MEPIEMDDRWRKKRENRCMYWWGADLASSLAVVLVHGAQGVAVTPYRRVLRQVVDELAAEPGSILDVVRAAPPVPALRH